VRSLLARFKEMSAANKKLFAALCCYAVLLGLALYVFLPANSSEEQLILGAVLLIFGMIIAKTIARREM